MPETFAGVASFSLRSISPFRQSVLYLLARITNHIEKQSGTESSFVTYLSPDIFPRSFQIEHIWADHYEEHTDEFTTLDEFAKYRNRLGGLLLLPNRINQSLNDAPYDMRVRAYFGQNLLAKSLNEQCYRNNPPFMAYINRSGLPFRPHPTFKKADLDARQELYRLICEEIWSPSRFDKELD